MFFKFESVDIEGFQSLGKCTLVLENQGFVAIKGINQFDAKTRSNGSGKTSLVESINWCLFGKTSAGVSNVKNRYYSNGCRVTVEFLLDGISYMVTRSQDHINLGTTLVVVKCGIDNLSCRNRSDTDKLLKTEILPFTQDIFLSTIFLSQGFSGRLSILTPSARKERLEILCNIDAAINDLKSKLTDKKNQLNSEYLEISKKVSYLNGQLQTYTADKAQTEIILQSVTKDDLEVTGDIEIYRQKHQTLSENIGTISEKINSFTVALTKLNSEKTTLENQTTSAINEMEKITIKLSNLRINSECPLCHQEIKNEELSTNLEKSLTDEFDALYGQVQKWDSELKIISAKISKALEAKQKLSTKLTSLNSMYKKISDKLSSFDTVLKNNAYIQEKAKRLEECTTNIARLSEEISTNSEKQTALELNVNVTDHMLKTITKDFRSYLLADVLGYMNSKLEEYSRELFENETDTIKISTETNKLDIYLGDSLYESLSGGEKKKVDLALVLAQREVALRISGFQCNLLVADELLENMDETSSNVSLNLLSKASGDIESLFMISHNNYSIPVDSTITVTKNSHRISEISLS